MDEILKIIVKCNKARKLLSTDDVKRICYIVLKKNGYDFVKRVYIGKNHPSDSNCGGAFLGDKIIFYFDGLIDIITKYAEKFTDTYQIDGSLVDVLNYYYLTIIFHELAHARQQFLIDKAHDCPEKKIFLFFYKIEEDRDFYEKNYENLLTEVNAVNVSHMTATYFYSKLPINYVSPGDKNIYQSAMMSALLYSNYMIEPHKEVVISPSERIANALTDEIFAKTNMDIEKYANMILNTKFTLYKKLMLGLPISYLEYAYAKLLIDVLSTEKDINVVKKLQKKVHE